MTGNAAEDQSALRAGWDHTYPLAEESSLTANRTPTSCGTTQQSFGGHGHLPIVLRFDRQRLTQSDTLKFVSEHDAIEELSDLFVFLADTDFADYCPIYEQLARAIAADTQLLEFVLTSASPNTRRGRIPVLFFAATHDRILANPDSEIAALYRGDSYGDPFPPFMDLLDHEREAIVTNMRTRSVQTNEAGRSAILSLAFGRARNDVVAPTALFEIGPSAGLNLFVDHFRIDFMRGDTLLACVGPQDAIVQLTCDVRGPNLPPFPADEFTPISRSGIDPNPIDVRSEEERRWLQACVCWPGIPDRPQRLAAALEVARTSPPHLISGDAVTDLGQALTQLPTSEHLIIFATWALAYINAEGRQKVLATIDEIGTTRDLDFITFEEPRFTGWVDPADAKVFETYLGEGTPTQLSLRSWRNGLCTTTALAIAHPHGKWIHWLEENHG